MLLFGGYMISLAGKAALVTGGSRGIGAATVKLFAQAGADVVFSYHRNREAATQVEQESRKHGTRIESCKADLGKMKEAKKLVDFTHERLGRLDILVANAGIWNEVDAPIEKLSEREWDDMLRVNLKSVYAVIHYATPRMIAQRSGRIIAVSSTSGQRGEAFHTHYSASKGAVISLTKGLSTELAPHNILVNCVAPGWVDTDMSKPTLGTKAGRKSVVAAIPLARVAKPDEIAGPILFAASDLATFVTGEVINVNGGAVLCG
jgi:3-oxoacyl-[acyl-carrier protein] reductase